MSCLRRNLSTKQFHNCRFLPEKSLTSILNIHGSTRLSWQYGASQPFSTSLKSFHSTHKDRSIVDLLESGEEILPSDIDLCTFTPRGAYIYLLENLHVSLDIDWQISIFLSSLLLRLAVIPATMAVNKFWKRKFFVLSTMKRSSELTEMKSEKGGVSADLLKLNNSVFNLGPQTAFLFTLRQNLPEIAAMLLVLESCFKINLLLGLDYLSTGYKMEWPFFLIGMMWTSLQLSPKVAFRQFYGSWGYAFLSINPALLIFFLPISVQSFIVPVFFVRALVQRLGMN